MWFPEDTHSTVSSRIELGSLSGWCSKQFHLLSHLSGPGRWILKFKSLSTEESPSTCILGIWFEEEVLFLHISTFLDIGAGLEANFSFTLTIEPSNR